MYRLLAALALFLLLSADVRGETRFRRPPGPGPNRDYRDNPTYEIGQDLDLKWDMDFDEAEIHIQQQDVNNNIPDPMSAEIVASTSSTRHVWTVTFNDFPADFDKTLSNVYYFTLQDASGTVVGGTTSHYFNITDPADSTTTSTVISTTAASTASSSTSESISQTETAASSSATANTDDEGGQGLSRGALVGVSVGATLGGLAVLAVLVGLGFLVWGSFGRNRPNQGQILPHEQPKPDTTPGSLVTTVVTPPLEQHYYPVPQLQYRPQPVQEIQHPRPIHEAPS
ncbi:hypothetical protein EDB81DRAFT_850517 [Dactylonectria macrodidyma]|uniref:Mid2 domain-containing protein n=1 Tax=Dactylonectria macrodidyma TaxID=307937 RepID=A0A9P9FSS5_9HYPO|nr:hypothetical protein EDB81DRAFT_850517 [Dactylonectria macrodidyma]